MTDPVTRIDGFDEIPLQVAQAASAIGEITELSGSVSLTRADGTQVPMSVGMPVFVDDVILTGSDGQVAVVFEDDSRIGLTENGEVQLDSYVYQPAQQSGEMTVNIVKGLFSFASGDIAKSGDEAMQIETPVATIGIRGTTGIGYAAPEGQENYFVLLPDADGTIGEISVRNAIGEEILTAPLSAVTVAGSDVAPTTPQLVTLEQLQERFPGIVELLGAYFDALKEQSDETNQQDGEDGSDDQGQNDQDENQDDTDIAEDDEGEFSEDFSEFEEDLSEEDLAAEDFESDLELVAGEDFGGSDDPLLDLGDAPTLPGFEDPPPDDDEGPSQFFNEQVDAGDVLLGGGDGTDPFGNTDDDVFGVNDPGTSGDDDPFQIPVTQPVETPVQLIGGLTVIKTTPLPPIVGPGGQSITVFSPNSPTGGVQGSSAFEQVAIDLPAFGGGSGGSSPVITFGQNGSGNVLIEGGGLNLALDQIEEVNLSTGGGADTIELGSLTNTDIAQNTIILNTGAGDDVVRIKDGESVGKNLDVFGGDGSDVISGSDGDDELYGNGGELLASTNHDWESDNELPVFTEDQTFSTNGATAANDINMTFEGETAISARFVSGNADTDNLVGYYKIGENGEISDVTFLFQNFGDQAASSGDEVSLDISDGDTIGMFIWSADLGFDPESVDGQSGRFEIQTATGDAAGLGDTGTQLVFITETSDGEGGVIDSPEILNGTLTHTVDPSMNAGGKDAAFAGVNPSNGGLRLGFDEFESTIDDLDYNDMVIELFEPADAANTVDNDILLGGDGNDSLFGESGNDILDGGDGIDFLFGGAGDDVLIGGAGFDVLNGGAGADTFTFNSLDDIPTGGRDVISDFDPNSDKIFLDGILSGSVIEALGTGELSITAAADTGGRTFEIAIGEKTIEVNLVDDGGLNPTNLVTSLAVA